jgi:hypothetical protein
MNQSRVHRHMQPIKPKGLVFGFWVWVFCKSLADFE